MEKEKNEEKRAKRLENENEENQQIRDMGQVLLDKNEKKHKIELLSIIGEVEGHESAPAQSKTTKYEQLRTSEHRSMYSYVRLSIDRCTATYV